MKLHMTVKRMCCLALCLLCLSVSVLQVAAAETREAGKASTVEAFAWSQETQYASVVHAEPDKESASVGNMKNGTPVTVLETLDGFYRIDCYGMDGYVAKSQVATKNGQPYIRCVIDSPETLILPVMPEALATELHRSMLYLAYQQLGKPYIYGSAGPRGFDCSGLTSYLYGSCGIQLDRRASQQLGNGLIVSREEMQPGDLLFFKIPGETALTSHVGIYVGDNMMIHAGNTGIICVELEGPYFGDCFQCVRRVVNAA